LQEDDNDLWTFCLLGVTRLIPVCDQYAAFCWFDVREAPEVATINDPSTDPGLACWALLVLFHGKCCISSFLRERDVSTAINGNSKAGEQQQQRDKGIAVYLLKTLHYKITKF